MVEKIPRRKFLTGIGAGAALALTPKIVSEIHEFHLRSTRTERPTTKITPTNVKWGTSPDKNSLDVALAKGNQLGKKPQIVNFFPFKRIELTDIAQIEYALSEGIIPMVSWPNKLEDVGKLNNFNDIIYVRPGIEINGNWYDQVEPDPYKEDWKKMRDNLKPNIKLIFSPNTTSIAKSFVPYFPGVDYVDIVALDVYNKHSVYLYNGEHYIFPCLSPEEELGPDIATFERIAPGIPFMLAEVNASIEFGRAEWIQKAITFACESGAFSWITFDWNKRDLGYGEIDWDVTDDHQVTQALQHELSKPYYL